MPSELPLNAGTLPAPYTCWQPLYNQMFSLGSAQGPTITGVIIQDAVPAAEDHDKGWIPTSAGVPRFPGYLFTWNNVLGHWVAMNPFAANDPRPQMYTADPSTVPTFDGGDANPPGVMGGPMWEVYTNFAGRVPVGLGTIPGSSAVISYASPPPTQDSLGNSGEYRHVLTGLEGAVADHAHPTGFGNTGTGDLGLAYVTPPVTVPSYTTFFNSSAGPSGTSTTLANLYTLKANDGNGIVSAAHNNMQPWIGVTFIRRTSRIWLVAA